MSLTDKINNDIKEAMKSKDKIALAAIRSIKSAILLEETKGGDAQVDDTKVVQIIQKLLKQRKDSAALYQEQGREDLVNEEMEQAAIIEKYLPQQLSAMEIKEVVLQAIQTTGATSAKDMGKVMGIVSKSLAGKADNKLVADVVKDTLAQL
ncbi:MAG: hypothetical protein RLZZ414_438 [Bacteroidota bacterium]|jgi:uncharacterized protein YqeY